MASFNEDPADRAAELERMLVGHACTLETAFGFYTLGDCRYATGDYEGAHEAWQTLHEANITNALTDQALFQDGRALDASGDLLSAIHAYNSFAARRRTLSDLPPPPPSPDSKPTTPVNLDEVGESKQL